MLPTISNTIGAMAAVFALVIGFPGAAQTGEPLDAYKAYLNAAAKATLPEALFPFISADYKTVLQQAPKTEVAKMLAMSVAAGARRSESGQSTGRGRQGSTSR